MKSNTPVLINMVVIKPNITFCIYTMLRFYLRDQGKTITTKHISGFLNECVSMKSQWFQGKCDLLTTLFSGGRSSTKQTSETHPSIQTGIGVEGNSPRTPWKKAERSDGRYIRNLYINNLPQQSQKVLPFIKPL